MRGKFITFEGAEGSGKSTQSEMAWRYLKAKGKKVLFIREPGGVKISEKIRSILLDTANKGMCDEAETLLYMAARVQLVHEVIEPALKEGMIVLCDRFLDSTIVYQGYGNGVDIDFIKTVGAFVVRNIKPDLTFVFDIDAKKGLSRIKRPKDRIERRALSYHQRVRNGYLKLAAQDPKRIKCIPVNKNKEEIHLIVRKYLERVLTN